MAKESPKSSTDQLHGLTTRDEFLAEQLAFLDLGADLNPRNADIEEIKTTPLFSMSVKRFSANDHIAGANDSSILPQYGLLAGCCSQRSDQEANQDPRIFLNVNAPWSAFICGSQGSGKSHTLSCMLEACLIPNSTLGSLPSPLTGLVFHYDSFSSAFGGQPCEVAHLCSHGLEVTVLVSPTNLNRMTTIYHSLLADGKTGNLRIEPLSLDQRYLNAERLLTLMAAGGTEGSTPLYMQTVLQVLRDMANDSSATPGINYQAFKQQVLSKSLSPAQLSPLSLRLDLLESFIAARKSSRRGKTAGNDWVPKPGKLTIVDLSCPFVDSDTACSLFGMCLGVFLEQELGVGRVVALDEAHKASSPLMIWTAANLTKFMKDSTASKELSESLMSTIRLQRHLACRVIIATQEPTISTQLLDLCSMTFVHRFTSPAWLKVLRQHLAAASSSTSNNVDEDLFAQIINLKVGEALLFSPSAMLRVENVEGKDEQALRKVVRMGLGSMEVRIRKRLTSDGGKSVCAV